MPPGRFDIARKDIVARLDAEGRSVFRLGDIRSILTENRKFWRLTERTRAQDLIEWLCLKSHLEVVPLDFPGVRDVYTWRGASAYDIAMAVGPRERTYIGYFTAAAIHGLTLQVPKVIYACVEQAAKDRPRAELTQADIDAAFRSEPRRSKYVADVGGGYRVCLVNAVASDGLGVIEVELPTLTKRGIRASNIERTLIDIAIRPHYGGGIHDVREAFRLAVDSVRVNQLRSYLLSLNHVYPIHQIIGFYMESAGYPESKLRMMASMPMEYDLPLAHGLDCPGHSKRWRVRYPEGFG